MDREYRDNFAYDLSKNIVTEGELHDYDAINQSIEIILSTDYGERVFLPNFGSILPSVLFENITQQSGENLLDTIISDIETWEDRITIISEQCALDIVEDENSISISIPYIVNEAGIVSSFEKVILF
jgi:phage baseplate assembly protein W